MQSFQQQEYFCPECGAAIVPKAQVCPACQQALPEDWGVVPLPVPGPVFSPTRLEVTAGGPATRPGPGALVHGRYSLVKEIGQGGFGSVYQAYDRQRFNRPVAIKQIDMSRLRPHEIIEATDTFNREVALLSALHHRSLPSMYESFTEGNCWYLVMKYIRGQTVEEMLQNSRRGYFSVYKTLSIGLDLCDVLHYLHRQKPPVIFRDVKPANIMVTRTHRIYLIDFGIARRFSPEKQRDTGPLGSPGYAAPEQYGKAQTDARTDIYSLGATLQTLLTGREPLELTAGEPSKQPGPLPTALQALLSSILETEPGKRPQTMIELEGKLEKLVAGRRALSSFMRGLMFGGIFLAAQILNSLLNILAHNGYFISSPLMALVLALNCFLPLGSLGCIIWQGVNFIEGKNRWLSTGMFVMLFLAFCLAIFTTVFLTGY